MCYLGIVTAFQKAVFNKNDNNVGCSEHVKKVWLQEEHIANNKIGMVLSYSATP